MLLASLGSGKSGGQLVLCLGFPKTSDITIYCKARNETRGLFSGLLSFLSSSVLVITTIFHIFNVAFSIFLPDLISSGLKFGFSFSFISPD